MKDFVLPLLYVNHQLSHDRSNWSPFTHFRIFKIFLTYFPPCPTFDHTKLCSEDLCCEVFVNIILCVCVCVCGILYLIQQEDIKYLIPQFSPGLTHVFSRLGVRILKGMECGLDSGFSSCYPAMDCCEHDWNFATVRLVQQLSAVRTIFCVIVSVSSSFFSVTGRSTQRSRICIRL
jgi:hypothetical protein